MTAHANKPAVKPAVTAVSLILLFSYLYLSYSTKCDCVGVVRKAQILPAENVTAEKRWLP